MTRDYRIFITNEGTPATGLSPEFLCLYDTASSPADVLPSSGITITELGNGLYEYTYNASEQLTGVIDCDPAGTTLNAPDRYKPVEMTAGDPQLERVITEITGTADAPATPLITQALMLLYMALRNETVASEDEWQLKNDAGTVVLEQDLSDDGSEFTRTKQRTPTA